MLTSDEYAAKGGHVCPYCEGDQLEGGSLDFEDSAVYQRVSCLDCEKDWVDSYLLVGYVE